MKFSPSHWVGSIGLLLMLVMCGFMAYMLLNYDELRREQVNIVRDYMNTRSHSQASPQP